MCTRSLLYYIACAGALSLLLHYNPCIQCTHCSMLEEKRRHQHPLPHPYYCHQTPPLTPALTITITISTLTLTLCSPSPFTSHPSPLTQVAMEREAHQREVAGLRSYIDRLRGHALVYMYGCMDAWMHGCMDAWVHIR